MTDEELRASDYESQFCGAPIVVDEEGNLDLANIEARLAQVPCSTIILEANALLAETRRLRAEVKRLNKQSKSTFDSNTFLEG